MTNKEKLRELLEDNFFEVRLVFSPSDNTFRAFCNKTCIGIFYPEWLEGSYKSKKCPGKCAFCIHEPVCHYVCECLNDEYFNCEDFKEDLNNG